MFNLHVIVDQIYTELIRSITGRLFTKKQIAQITSHAIGKYFAEYFPEPEREKKAIERVEEAKEHINEAGAIIAAMHADLEQQTSQLDALLEDIEEKKRMAEKYAELASTNQEKFAAFKDEMGQVLREELTQQSEQGKTLRRIVSTSIWLVTLIVGAALGAYFIDIVSWVKKIIN